MRMVEPMRMNIEAGKFESVVMGGNVPSNYIPAVEKVFYEVLKEGTLSGNPISGVRMVLAVLRDGACHRSTRPSSPIMTVPVVASVEFQNASPLPLFPPSCPFGRNQIDYFTIAPTWRAA